jgi:hypothetical protein
VEAHKTRFALSNIDSGFVNIVAPTPTPAPVPVADNDIGGIEVDVAGTPSCAIPNDPRVAVCHGVTLNTSVEIRGN